MIKHCEGCEDCIYIGEGDYICSKNINGLKSVLVIEDWTPTENFLQCTERREYGEKKE